jgi:hypothetical protein
MAWQWLGHMGVITMFDIRVYLLEFDFGILIFDAD